MIPQYRTLKLKLPKYRVKKAQYRNTVNPHVSLYNNEFKIKGNKVLTKKILNHNIYI